MTCITYVINKILPPFAVSPRPEGGCYTYSNIAGTFKAITCAYLFNRLINAFMIYNSLKFSKSLCEKNIYFLLYS